jgi:hypothetical protein
VEIIFGLIFINKSNQNQYFFWKTKPKLVQTDRFRFSYFEEKTGSNRFFSSLARFFRFDSVFSGFFGLGSVRFFWLQAYKTESVGFFKILIGFFSYFFSSFLGLIGFFAHPN